MSLRRPYDIRLFSRQSTLRALLQARTRRHLATESAGSDHTLGVGQQLHGFTLKRQKHVPELQLTAYQLQHDKTGAEYLHVDRDDKNNVFSIAFKTNPPDDTGVPHILEHTTLCGSKKYEVRPNSWVQVNISPDIQSGTPSSRCCQDLCQIS